MIIGGLAGAVVSVIIKAQLPRQEAPGPDAASVEDAPPDQAAPEVVRESVAWQYARAYQEGNWTRVVALTLWMQDRLSFVATSEGQEKVPAARDALIAQVSTRGIADNYLRDTGVEDQYVFTPGSRLVYMTVDEGRDDLAAAVASRTWFKVTFPARSKALLDREGIPIRSVRVGVNVSAGGLVLKAGVVGNLDIDWDSIAYDWPSR